MAKSRRVTAHVRQDLEDKMVFIAGPRQAGKTTVARELLAEIGGTYYSWDSEAHRRILRRSELDEGSRLWVLDELHKYRQWRNWLKGQYDLHADHHTILVTGSAKLDVYSRGGDSLQGRYFLYRLHPFTFSEFLGTESVAALDELFELGMRTPKGADVALSELLQLSGFPEPLLKGSDRRAARWRLGYGTRLIREEVRAMEQIRDLDKLEVLFDRLPDTVGSVLSVNSIRKDLEVAFETAREWLSIFERMYASFQISPFGPPRIKAVKKAQKLYLWDWARVSSRPARFENLIAFHLLRFQHWCEDIYGERVELRYFRDVAGHEVNFILFRHRKPWVAIEVKESDRPLDSGLKYFLERVKTPYAFQISLTGTKDYRAPDINGCRVRLLPAATFLANLP